MPPYGRRSQRGIKRPTMRLTYAYALTVLKALRVIGKLTAMLGEPSQGGWPRLTHGYRYPTIAFSIDPTTSPISFFASNAVSINIAIVIHAIPLCSLRLVSATLSFAAAVMICPA